MKVRAFAPMRDPPNSSPDARSLARTHTQTTTLKSNKHLLNVETTPHFSRCKLGWGLIVSIHTSCLMRIMGSGCFDCLVHTYVNTLSTAA